MIASLLRQKRKAFLFLMLFTSHCDVRLKADTLFSGTSSYGTGWNVPIGYQFHVGSQPITVYRLGLPNFAANAGYYDFVVELKSLSGNVLLSNSIAIPGGAPNNSWFWVTNAPVTLEANKDYITTSRTRFQNVFGGGTQGASTELYNPSLSSTAITLTGSVGSAVGGNVILQQGGGWIYLGPNMSFWVSQSINFPAIPDQTYSFYASPLTLTASASSGLPVTYSVASGPASISSNKLTVFGAGSVTVAADQRGNTNFLAAPTAINSFYVAPSDQSISFNTQITNQTYGTNSIALNGVGSSGIPVSYSVSGPATLSNNILTITGAGTVTVVANQAGNENYNAASPVTNTFAVKLTQAIGGFSATTNITYGIAPFVINPPVASSGLPVSVSVASGPASIFSNTITIQGAGTVSLTANQAGNGTYYAAYPISSSFIVAQASQSINGFSNITAHTFGDAPYSAPIPSASSGLPVTLSIQKGPATISGNTVTLTGAGTVTLAADQPGNANYLPAQKITTNFIVSRATQNITPFGIIPGHTYGDGSFSISSLNASSGLPTALSIKSGPASISGNTVTLAGVGTVTVAANQAGNANYNAAPEVTTSFVVSRASQTISSFSPIPSQVLGAPSFSIGSLTASSGLPVTLSIKSGPATISGNTITLTGTGTVTVAANQSGDENWNAAPEVTTSFVVKSYGQTIGAFSAISDKFYGASPFLITLPIANSKLPVAVTVKSGPARISNNKVTITGAGTVVLAAIQAGNASFAPAAEVTTSFTVYPANQTIRIPQKLKPPVQAGVYPLPSFNSTAGLPVSFSVMSGPAYISGSNYVVTGPGRVWVAVDQVGNSNYNAARQVSFYFDVGKSTQSISANGINIPSIPGTYALPSIYSSAGLPVDLMLVSGPVRDEGYPYYTITGPGLVTVRLKQAGDDYYKPARDLVVSFRVKLYDQAIYPFRSIQDQTYGAAPFVVPAPLASSGLPVTVSVKSGPARIRNRVLTITGRGVVTLSANQAGNVKYNAATPITTSFSVN
jgi:hypothetical protein